MGKTLHNLAARELNDKAVFNNRFVIELCEKFHLHYRNLRIVLSKRDFIELCYGIIQAFQRWEKRGAIDPAEGRHLELCRKQVAIEPVNENIKVNLNENLYKKYDGQIFAEGAGFSDDTYVHLKIRDLRIELSHKEFMELTDAITEAKERLKDCCISTCV